MKRLSIEPRINAGAKLESIGLSFHAWDDYWREDVCYRFTAEQVDLIEARTEELHGMCLKAVEHVLENKRLGELGIPAAYWPAIEASYKNGDRTLYGRFDLAYDGAGEPKLLEYNADTPTSLLETAAAQWYWLVEKFPNADQFNSLHEQLVERWKSIVPEGASVYFASLEDVEEDWVCVHYLMDTAQQAQLKPRYIELENIGWDPDEKVFIDNENLPIHYLFKLYPWEMMMREEFGPNAIISGTNFIEPIWKSILSCKAILPILWELFPGHRNLLPAYFDQGDMTSFAKKPFYSREGANIDLVEEGRTIASDSGPYGNEKCIYQELYKLPNFDGKYPVIGSWIVGDKAAGMCIREDSMLVTTNMSNFVPHYFEKEEE